MTEKEVLDLQEERGNQVFYLILIGSFLNAYGNGAFALSRATGYRVIRKQRKQMGEVLTAGFPVSSLGGVREKLLAAGGELDEVDEKTWIFRGIDGTPDLAMVTDPKPRQQSQQPASSVHDSWLMDEVRRFNLSMSTPMDAMNLIARLQQRIKQEDIAEKVQGADCPQGKAPGIACESPSGQGSAE